MRYCKKCAMPDTRPGSIFDKEGVCRACRNYENRKTINWDERK
ncbi:MAG: N-acetyl sugar amidotransferase, partial [Phycisphaerae bacterium]|nr:N-acetyl sugar amidotransferase [Phycisphaerae bacterium]MDD5064934.1 N-acetyl sugar amidotransferase [Phycisphaerae bacterium]MDD5381763.1 N-acetyl sugar amidotransferase [Phycisphaerae bacterium]MDD5381836.1 N-acetyl sugar amidotransferase [Phycisphaerae bacterium]